MPNCFTLTRRDNLTAGPVPLNQIDEDLCRHFGADVHPTNWFGNWYNSVGFMLAMGRTMAEVKAEMAKWDAEDEAINGKFDDDDVTRVKIAEYIDATYTSDAWAEVGRR